MKILFLHQNFPAQFRQFADLLASIPGNEIIGLKQPPKNEIPGMVSVAYQFLNKPRKDIHPLLPEMEAKVLRGEAVAHACERLKKLGWNPEVIVAHPGWGEALFVREIWPAARLVMYCEYYYHIHGQDFNFDPEFPEDDTLTTQKLKLKNTVMLHALHDADVAYTPTEWQRDTFPEWARPKIRIVHEGIDTNFFKPNPKARFQVANKGIELKAGDEVITYAARSLEPVRGFHVFMRALPEILRQRPNAHVVIMGREPVAYGKDPADAKSWQEKMLAELGDLLDPKRVHLVGFLPRDQYLAVMQVSKVHVYLTYPFLLSWSMLEAMACGALIVGSDTGPVREIVQDGKNGVLTPFFDIPRLAQTIVGQLKLPAAKASTMRKAARQWVMEHYEMEQCLADTLSLVSPPEKTKAPVKKAAKPAAPAKKAKPAATAAKAKPAAKPAAKPQPRKAPAKKPASKKK